MYHNHDTILAPKTQKYHFDDFEVIFLFIKK